MTPARQVGAGLAVLGLLVLAPRALAGPGTIRAAVYSGAGVIPIPDPAAFALSLSEEVVVHSVDGGTIRAGALKADDVLVVPGGFADEQAAALGPEGLSEVRRFVAEGGAYVGICAGAYLATAHPVPRAGSLELLDVMSLPPWQRGAGPLRVGWPGEAGSFPMYYENGPVFGLAGRPDLPRPVTILEYRSGVGGADDMAGLAAVVAGSYGRGRVVLFGPHPERTPGRAWMLERAIEWCVRRPHAARPARWAEVFGVYPSTAPDPSVAGVYLRGPLLVRAAPPSGGTLAQGARAPSPDLRELFRPLVAALPGLGGPFVEPAEPNAVDPAPGGPASDHSRSDPLVRVATAPFLTSPLHRRSAFPLRGHQ